MDPAAAICYFWYSHRNQMQIRAAQYNTIQYNKKTCITQTVKSPESVYNKIWSWSLQYFSSYRIYSKVLHTYIQTYRRTDGRTDGTGHRYIPASPTGGGDIAFELQGTQEKSQYPHLVVPVPTFNGNRGNGMLGLLLCLLILRVLIFLGIF